jgi:hypothetical protein
MEGGRLYRPVSRRARGGSGVFHRNRRRRGVGRLANYLVAGGLVWPLGSRRRRSVARLETVEVAH